MCETSFVHHILYYGSFFLLFLSLTFPHNMKQHHTFNLITHVFFTLPLCCLFHHKRHGKSTRVVMVTKDAPSHWIGNTNTRTSAMLSICPHTATLVWLLGLWCHSSHSSTCVWDEGLDGNHCHFNTTCGTHTSETVMGATHSCPCFIHSMVCVNHHHI